MPNRVVRWSAVLCLAFAVEAGAAEPGFRVETLTDGLNFPWAIVFLPNGDMLITDEQPGGVRRFSNGVLLPDPVAGAPTQLQGGDGGLLDIVLDPNFSENGFVYISFAEGSEEANHTALFRARFDGTALVDGAVIFRAGPDKVGQGHFGSRIVFLSDETLLMTIGEGYDFREKAQEYRRVLRLDNRASVRDTFYSEVLDLIASYECGFAAAIVQETKAKGHKLSSWEVDVLFAKFESQVHWKPLVEKARNKMASRDLAFRDALHLQLKEYVLPLQREEFERFLGEKSKELSERLEEAKDVMKRLKERV